MSADAFSERLSALSAGPPPVCVTGMHRSGTSTVAHLLSRAGLYLGDEDEFPVGNASNPDGYWENVHFRKINNDILAELGGGWDVPPSPPPGWEHQDEVQRYREPALALIKRFEGGASRQRPWGWKDPRTSLTLPFWLDVLPDLRVVICLRNPVEVALSVRERGASSMALGLNLWKAYTRTLLAALAPDRCIVSHYEAYFHRPQEEMRRVVDFAGIPASDQLLALIRSRVIRGLRHHMVTTDELRDHDPSGELEDLYQALCAKAEWDP